MTEAQSSERRPYREGVGIVLLDSRGHAFVAQRNDTPEPAWQFPQGGIDAGETPLIAALREMKEEIGTGKAELLAETAEWIAYDLPADLAERFWGGRYRGQRQKWFAFRFLGTDADIDIATEHPEFSAWRWMPLPDIPPLIVPFKRSLYDAVVAEFLPVAERMGGRG
ncbi:MAG: RNA pyrophosphohydrolase [Magnetospirillum sp.]|nr:RNA pyrophosphohydrolase [Magnetospirillum sp.]